MRTVHAYALGVCLLLAANVIASPLKTGADDPLTVIKKWIVKILDEVAVKPGLPPG
jgi:hypothetical protein